MALKIVIISEAMAPAMLSENVINWHLVGALKESKTLFWDIIKDSSFLVLKVYQIYANGIFGAAKY